MGNNSVKTNNSARYLPPNCLCPRSSKYHSDWEPLQMLEVAGNWYKHSEHLHKIASLPPSLKDIIAWDCWTLEYKLRHYTPMSSTSRIKWRKVRNWAKIAKKLKIWRYLSIPEITFLPPPQERGPKPLLRKFFLDSWNRQKSGKTAEKQSKFVEEQRFFTSSRYKSPWGTASQNCQPFWFDNCLDCLENSPPKIQHTN